MFEKKVLLSDKGLDAWTKLAFAGLTYPASGAKPGQGYSYGGAMKKGGKVDKTALYLLHKGEKVIPAGTAKKRTAKFTPKYDNNPGLRGGQKKLPDIVQKGILKKAGEARRNAILMKVALMRSSGK